MTIYQKVSGGPRPGDRITVTTTVTETTLPIKVRAFSSIRGENEITLFGDYEITVERPVEVPTKPGAVLWPHDLDVCDPLFIDSTGIWVDGDGEKFHPSYAANLLSNGALYVAFEGIQA